MDKIMLALFWLFTMFMSLVFMFRCVEHTKRTSWSLAILWAAVILYTIVVL
jgi:hypothetical protein